MPRDGDIESPVGQTRPTVDETFSEERGDAGEDESRASDAPAPERATPADDGSYRECLARIRRRLAGRKIWASLDETADPTDGEPVGSVVVGALSPDGPGEAFLLASGSLRCDRDAPSAGQAAARLFDAAMGQLWPDRGGCDLLLLVCGLSADADRETIAARWPAVEQKRTVRVGCVARRLRAVAERLRAEYPAVESLVSTVRREFSRDPTRPAELRARAPDAPPMPPVPPPSRARRGRPSCSWIRGATYLSENLGAVRSVLVDRPGRRESWPAWQAGRQAADPSAEPWLAFVDLNYGFLPAAVARIEARGVPLTRSTAEASRAADRLAAVPGQLGAALHRRFADALRDDRGFRALSRAADIMAGRGATMDGLPARLSGNDLKYLKYAPVAAADVREMFPRHEAAFTRENRLAYGERDLNKLLVVRCNVFADGGDDDDDVRACGAERDLARESARAAGRSEIVGKRVRAPTRELRRRP